MSKKPKKRLKIVLMPDVGPLNAPTEEIARKQQQILDSMPKGKQTLAELGLPVPPKRRGGAE